MKTLVALLFVTLICLLHQDSADAKRPPVPLSDECCLAMTDKGIPRDKVTNVTETPSNCRGHKAFIVTTEKQKKICVDPSCSWVKKNKDFLNEFLKK
ncbi:eotaxin-like [Sphaeramia orbicularis]|uniref:eotaxin-like n=1 Tax=Sphaeramia orbicularis TaxID=375764 RepID=UPI00117EA177|nr:eotaxin-like [Sphaeramia orbicularis]XP_029986663.1 eotaxin-like [Sphaeramia orbicularis]